jgi:hypothetical protein
MEHLWHSFTENLELILATLAVPAPFLSEDEGEGG